MLQTVLADDPETSPASRLRSLLIQLRTRAILKGLVLAVLVMLVAETLRIFVGSNLHEVVAGKCYRAGQPSPDFLETMRRTHGICSVLNLRDENEDEPWYQREKQTCQRLGLQLINAGLSSNEQPPEDDFWKFVQATRDCAEPVLIHCANGNDRTGFASGVYLLLRTDTTLPQARRHLSLRYGHFAWTRASCLHRILDSYETWLDHRQHTAERFCEWAQYHYRQEPNPARRAADGSAAIK